MAIASMADACGRRYFLQLHVPGLQPSAQAWPGVQSLQQAFAEPHLHSRLQSQSTIRQPHGQGWPGVQSLQPDAQQQPETRAASAAAATIISILFIFLSFH